VHFSWDEARQKATVYSIRNIEEGEEIVNCYISPFLSRNQRQQYFAKNFGFQCTCKACSLEGKALEASDNRRSNLAQLEAMTRDALQSKSRFVVKSLVSLRMQLLEEEGLLSPVTMLRCEVDKYLALTGKVPDDAPLGSSTNSNSYLVGNDGSTNDKKSGSGTDRERESADGASVRDADSLEAVDREESEEALLSAIEHATLCKGSGSAITKWCKDELNSLRL
jgi:hypothetical protein